LRFGRSVHDPEHVREHLPTVLLDSD